MSAKRWLHRRDGTPTQAPLHPSLSFSPPFSSLVLFVLPFPSLSSSSRPSVCLPPRRHGTDNYALHPCSSLSPFPHKPFPSSFNRLILFCPRFFQSSATPVYSYSLFVSALSRLSPIFPVLLCPSRRFCTSVTQWHIWC